MGAAFAAGALAGLRSLSQAQQSRNQAQADALNLALGKQKLESGQLELGQAKQMGDLQKQMLQSQNLSPLEKFQLLADPGSWAKRQSYRSFADQIDVAASQSTDPKLSSAMRSVANYARMGNDPSSLVSFYKTAGVFGPDQFDKMMQALAGNMAQIQAFSGGGGSGGGSPPVPGARRAIYHGTKYPDLKGKEVWALPDGTLYPDTK